MRAYLLKGYQSLMLIKCTIDRTECQIVDQLCVVFALHEKKKIVFSSQKSSLKLWAENRVYLALWHLLSVMVQILNTGMKRRI